MFNNSSWKWRPTSGLVIRLKNKKIMINTCFSWCICPCSYSSTNNKNHSHIELYGFIHFCHWNSIFLLAYSAQPFSEISCLEIFSKCCNYAIMILFMLEISQSFSSIPVYMYVEIVLRNISCAWTKNKSAVHFYLRICSPLLK